MKRNLSILLVLSALVMTAGCKKNLPASVDVGKNAKAGMPTNPSWAAPGKFGRLIRFDIDDGNGSSCIFSYDISTGNIALSQVIGSSGTNIISQTMGIPLSTGGTLSVTTDNPDCTDAYNEVGGVHIISFDAGGMGHEDHLLYYIPGRGILYLLSYNPSTKNFSVDWSSSSGIAGYDLKGFYDKIIAYDYGSGAKNAIVVYRPGSGFVWIIQNIGSGNSPSWYPEVKGSGGIGGFDLKGYDDQIIAVERSPGAMDLCCYRPGPNLGYVWYLNHSAYSMTWIANYTSRSGLSANGYTNHFNLRSDRMIPGNTTGNAGNTTDDQMFCYTNYIAGTGNGFYPDIFAINGGVVSGGPVPPNLGGLYGDYPYPSYEAFTYEGDHWLAFNGNGEGNSSLVSYSNGATAPSQIWEFNKTIPDYFQVY